MKKRKTWVLFVLRTTAIAYAASVTATTASSSTTNTNAKYLPLLIDTTAVVANTLCSKAKLCPFHFLNNFDKLCSVLAIFGKQISKWMY